MAQRGKDPVLSLLWQGFCFCFAILSFFRADLTAYGGSQARGPIRVLAAGLHHSRSNEGSEPRLRPIPQFTATPDP